MTFESFGIDALVLDALRELGYEKPTPVQEKAIPIILEGKDLIALAETGSGKTAACAIPVSHKVDPTLPHIQGLILVPARELALQYATETQKIGRFKGVKSFALFGGEDMDMQRSKLKAGVHILIATPGRLIDFVFSRSIDLSHVTTLILDEADQMLGMGFYEDLEFIIQCLVQSHQTLLFSATMPKEIREIARRHMKDPVELSLISKDLSPPKLEHFFSFCPSAAKKPEELIALLEKLDPKQCLIFGNSRKEVEDLFWALKRKISSIDWLHGGLEQNLRTTITGKFQRGKTRFLIATDVASRGMDFSNVTHVINYHMPRDNETYLHRAGRTARSGREGACITLVSQRDLSRVPPLLKAIRKEAHWIKPPPRT